MLIDNSSSNVWVKKFERSQWNLSLTSDARYFDRTRLGSRSGWVICLPFARLAAARARSGGLLIETCGWLECIQLACSQTLHLLALRLWTEITLWREHPGEAARKWVKTNCCWVQQCWPVRSGVGTGASRSRASASTAAQWRSTFGLPIVPGAGLSGANALTRVTAVLTSSGLATLNILE